MQIPDIIKNKANWTLINKDKIPVQTNGRKAGAGYTKTYDKFDNVYQEYLANPNKYSGLGWALTTDIVFIDFDNVVTKIDDDLVIDNEVIEWIEKFDSYTEFSQSNKGIHILIRGSKKGEKCKKVQNLKEIQAIEDKQQQNLIKKEYEMYCPEKNGSRGRIAGVTGKVLTLNNKTYNEINTNIDYTQNLLNEFYDKHIYSQSDNQIASISSIKSVDSELSNEIVKKAVESIAKKEKILGIWEGKYKEYGYPSGSEADFALISHLVWITENPNEILEIFQLSEHFEIRNKEKPKKIDLSYIKRQMYRPLSQKYDKLLKENVLKAVRHSQLLNNIYLGNYKSVTNDSRDADTKICSTIYKLTTKYDTIEQKITAIISALKVTKHFEIRNLEENNILLSREYIKEILGLNLTNSNVVDSVSNGTSTNGTSTNGTSTNGTSTNGTSTNGTSTDFKEYIPQSEIKSDNQLDNIIIFPLELDTLELESDQTKKNQILELINKIPLNFTQVEYSVIFANKYENKLKYDHKNDCWYFYNDKYYELDVKHNTTNYLIQTIKEIQKYVSDLIDYVMESDNLSNNQKSNDLKKLSKYVANSIKVENANFINNVLNLASENPKLSARIEEFDNDYTLFPMNNGLFDLKTFKLIELSPKYMFTSCSNVNYDPTATCEKWLKFLDEVFLQDKELIYYFQQLVGYSLTGETSEQIVIFMNGDGNNGKSVIKKVLENLLGGYFQQKSYDFIIESHNEKESAVDYASMRGKRFVSVNELPKGKYFNESKLKLISGGDTLPARYLHGKEFHFKPTHKVWLDGNHKPNIRGTDTGIWRRIRIIPFKYKVPEEKIIDFHVLVDSFLSELSGIFNWAIQGEKNRKLYKLQTPPAVIKANELYRKSQDMLGQFFDECCEKDITATIQTRELHKCYTEWCKEEDITPMKSKSFNIMVNERGFDIEMGRSNAKYFLGIKIKNKSSIVDELNYKEPIPQYYQQSTDYEHLDDDPHF